MADLSLKCDCGKLRGTVRDITPAAGTHVVCYCHSCQEFARKLGKDSSVLDEYGGTDLFQTAPNRISITEGAEHIRCLKITGKGPYRWYAGCCNSPIANTATPNIPFTGLITNIIAAEDRTDSNLGPVGWYVQGADAAKPLPPGRKIVGFPLPLVLRLGINILFWKLTGKGRPSPFFREDDSPVAKPLRIYEGQKIESNGEQHVPSS